MRAYLPSDVDQYTPSDDLPPATNSIHLGLQPYSLGSLSYKKCISSAALSTSDFLKEYGVIFKMTRGTFAVILSLGLNYVQGYLKPQNDFLSQLFLWCDRTL